ncbi:MAG: ornithine carbamoyltransferase [Proteobacteria bacterium]|nr:ornithine carbamoyltransferase [Pseudomonadota bacterium]
MAEAPRHFLDLDRVSAATLRHILGLARDIKAGGGGDKPLAGKTLAMIFEKPSTRTRVSFQVGMQQLGGAVVVIGDGESHLGISETVADTARVLSRFVDVIVIRTDAPAKIDELADHATVPVINGLTDASHPCQLMADVMTFEEHRGPIMGRTVAWCGDGNNMATSWIHAAVRLEFRLRLACPGQFSPSPELMDWAAAEGGDVALSEDVGGTVADADCVVTDAWVSMGYPDAEARRRLLAPYRVDEGVMAKARPDALFMHCLPAHRGEEVTDAVIDGPNSVVWDEAENRLHAQKGILTWCLG